MATKHDALCMALLLSVALGARAHAEPGARVRHVPPAEARPGAPLELMANVSQAWEATLELRYRALGTSAWQSTLFARRTQDVYAATIPAAALAPPGIEYFILSTRPDATTALHFGSAELPHQVHVYPDPAAVRREQYLARHHHRRAQIRLAGEFVDYGSRELAGKTIPDRYYRVDAGVGYRLLRFPLASLRFGYTHMIGETPVSTRDEPGECSPADPAERCTVEAGLKGGGWFELHFVLRDGIDLDARGMVMATQEGFNVGGRGELRLGDLAGNHLALGTEIIADVGTAGFVRLGWGTVPGFPMAATVEVTDFPSAHRAAAVRLVYDVARPLANGFRVGARIGYQARDQRVGGMTLGLNTALEF